MGILFRSLLENGIGMVQLLFCKKPYPPDNCADTPVRINNRFHYETIVFTVLIVSI
jgi:hypothetical protein